MPKGVKSIKYEGISFVAQNIAKLPFDQFSKEHAHHNLTVDQLREVHGMAVQALKPVPVAEKTETKK